MTQIINNYARVLYELGIQPEVVLETKRRYDLTKELPALLNSPVIANKTKHKIIEKIFNQEMISFLKVICDYHSIHLLSDILEAYVPIYQEENAILGATLTYVTEPDKKQLQQILNYLTNRFHKKKVQLHMKECPELIGGFVIRVGDLEIDWSLRGRLKRLEEKLIRR